MGGRGRRREWEGENERALVRACESDQVNCAEISILLQQQPHHVDVAHLGRDDEAGPPVLRRGE